MASYNIVALLAQNGPQDSELARTGPGLSLVVVAVLVGGFVVCALGAGLSGRSTNQSSSLRMTGNRWPGFTALVLLGLGLGCFTTITWNVNTTQKREQNAVHQLLLQETKTDVAVDTIQALPDWTRKLQTIVSRGQVDNVLLVEESTLCATQHEAVQEATAGAVKTLKNRIVADWPEMDTWIIPVDLFHKSSYRQTHVETQTHTFGGVQEPMFQSFLQFEDSAAVREQLIERWRADVQTARTTEYALGLGSIAVGLGVVSAVLRGLLAFAARRGKTVPA